MSHLGGHRPSPTGESSTPLIPQSLKAIRGEGEIRIDVHVRAQHSLAGHRNSVLGESGVMPFAVS